jgi:DNA-binding GntR family transcriptional regulator/DNA-binding MarR family transcriptional regulator
MPLRQVLLRLEADGLIEIRLHRSAVIVLLAPSEIEEIYATRTALEGLLAEVGANHCDPTRLARMKALLADMEQATAVSDTDTFVGLDRLFHRELYGASGYERTMEILDILRESSDRYIRFYAAYQHGAEQSLQEHRELLTAVRTGDSARVRHITEHHILRGANAMQQLATGNGAVEASDRGTALHSQRQGENEAADHTLHDHSRVFGNAQADSFPSSGARQSSTAAPLFVKNPAHLDFVRKLAYNRDMSDSDQVGPLMIGALVTMIGHDLRRRVTAALHAQGYADYRSTYHEVFMLTRAEGSRITELAELAQVTRQAMSELVTELERRGYVERSPDPTDRRAVLVRRTARGWQVNVIARQVVQEAQREWAARVGEHAYANMLAVLQQVVALIGPPAARVAGHPRTRPYQPPAAASASESDTPGLSPHPYQNKENELP